MPNVFSALSLSGIFSLRDILWGMDLDRASADGMGHVADEPISKLCLNW